MSIHQNSRGSILLTLSIIVFLFSATLAGVIAFRLYQKENLQTREEKVAESNDAQDSSLVILPEFVVAEGVGEDKATLEKLLFTPMRQYYAIKEDRLGDVTITPSEDEEHTAEVTYQLVSGGKPNIYTFFYDREGEDRDGDFPKWSVNMLDNTI